jgi:hypothetical protein
MKGRVFILPEGKIQLFVDEGTEEEARALTKKVFAQLRAAGVPLQQTSDIELHRTPGVEHVHIHQEHSR